MLALCASRARKGPGKVSQDEAVQRAWARGSPDKPYPHVEEKTSAGANYALFADGVWHLIEVLIAAAAYLGVLAPQTCESMS